MPIVSCSETSLNQREKLNGDQIDSSEQDKVNSNLLSNLQKLFSEVFPEFQIKNCKDSKYVDELIKSHKSLQSHIQLLLSECNELLDIWMDKKDEKDATNNSSPSNQSPSPKSNLLKKYERSLDTTSRV